MSEHVTTGELAKALIRHTRRELSDFANAAPPYRMLALSGAMPDGFRIEPEQLRQGNRARGAAILAHRYTLAGDTLQLAPGDSIWSRPAPSRRFAASLHGFDWLTDLLSVKEDEARQRARALTDDWIEQFGHWNWFAWSPGVTASRLRAWLAAGPALIADDDAAQQARRLRALGRMVHRLRRALPLMDNNRDRLQAVLSLALAGVSLDLDGTVLRDANQALGAALKSQILPDGGHVSRNPQAAAETLIDLAVLEEAAVRRGVELDAEVRRALDRIAPLVRFFLMPGGGLAAFHGGGEGDGRAIESALQLSGASRRSFNVAPHSGYHRASAGGVHVVIDGAGPPPGAHAAESHASALAFEMATPGGKLVVNCGWSADQPGSWREPVRATAAHSVLTLEETSSARLLQPGWQRKLLGPRIASGPEPVKARRNEEDMGIWLEATHDGYRKKFGLSLRRRLFLANDGGDLRGEDGLFRPVEDGPPDDPEKRYTFAIRFHLHPDVRASLSRDALSALLVQPNGEGWRFRTDGGTVRLERSVYLAAGAPPQRSTQLVVSGDAEPYGGGDRPPNRVRWAFQRLGRMGSAG